MSQYGLFLIHLKYTKYSDVKNRFKLLPKPDRTMLETCVSGETPLDLNTSDSIPVATHNDKITTMCLYPIHVAVRPTLKGKSVSAGARCLTACGIRTSQKRVAERSPPIDHSLVTPWF